VKRLIALVAATLLSASNAAAQSLAGDWLGTLDTGALKLRLVFHVTDTPKGPTATVDSLDQNARGIPVTRLSRDGSSVRMELAGIGGTFIGKIDDAGKTIAGTWTQGAGSLPLTISRATDSTPFEPRRPQNPRRPYAYDEGEVTYNSRASGVRLAATLTLPNAKGPFPAVVLITGSGPQDRDESIVGHKPFLVLADYLTRRGFAVLRADDRGVGKSTGDFSTATTADFAADAEGGLAFLQTLSDIDHRKIGLIGHSEGAVIASMVAARNPAVAFIVMLSGTGVRGDEIILAQSELIAAAAGAGREQIEKNRTVQREALALLVQEKDDARLESKLRTTLSGQIPESQLGGQLKTLMSPWYRYFIAYDPAPALRQVTVPVLAINGEKDLQAPSKQNVPAIRAALEAGGNRNIEIVELPGLNHLLQTAPTGSPSEYGQIEETMAPLALEKIATWLARVAR